MNDIRQVIKLKFELIECLLYIFKSKNDKKVDKRKLGNCQNYRKFRAYTGAGSDYQLQEKN